MEWSVLRRPGGEMANATDLKSVAARLKGSSPFPGTIAPQEAVLKNRLTKAAHFRIIDMYV